MNINDLIKLKVYDRYDWDLLSLMYDENEKKYYIEYLYDFEGKYLYFQIDEIQAREFTYGRCSLAQALDNSIGLLYDNAIFHKEIGMFNKNKRTADISELYDWAIKYYYKDWTLKEHIAYDLMGFYKAKEQSNDCKYMDNTGAKYGEIELNEITDILTYIDKIKIHHNINIQMNNTSVSLQVDNFPIIEANCLEKGLIYLLQQYFYGIHDLDNSNLIMKYL